MPFTPDMNVNTKKTDSTKSAPHPFAHLYITALSARDQRRSLALIFVYQWRGGVTEPVEWGVRNGKMELERVWMRGGGMWCAPGAGDGILRLSYCHQGKCWGVWSLERCNAWINKSTEPGVFQSRFFSCVLGGASLLT